MIPEGMIIYTVSIINIMRLKRKTVLNKVKEGGMIGRVIRSMESSYDNGKQILGKELEPRHIF